MMNKLTPLSRFCSLLCFSLGFASDGALRASADPAPASPAAASATSNQSASAPSNSAAQAPDAVFAPQVAPVGGAAADAKVVVPLAVLAFQDLPQAIWQGRSPIGALDTVIYSDGTVIYDYGNRARAQHDGYNRPTKVVEAGIGVLTYSQNKWKIAHLDQVQLNGLIDSLHEPDLDSLDKPTYNYTQLPHYMLTYWTKDTGGSGEMKARTITLGGPLNSGDCDDLYYKTDNLDSLNTAPDYEVDDARRHAPKALLWTIDRLQYYDVAQAAFAEPNLFWLQLSSGSKSKAQPWPDDLPVFDESAFKTSDTDSNGFTADLQQEDYQTIQTELAKRPRNNQYMIAGKPWHVSVQSDYTPPFSSALEAALTDNGGD